MTAQAVVIIPRAAEATEPATTRAARRPKLTECATVHVWSPVAAGALAFAQRTGAVMTCRYEDGKLVVFAATGGAKP